MTDLERIAELEKKLARQGKEIDNMRQRVEELEDENTWLKLWDTSLIRAIESLRNGGKKP